MSKRFFIILAVIFLLTPPLTVYADVVFSNAFLSKNKDKTEQLGNAYSGIKFCVNSPLGYVIPRDEPGSKNGVSTTEYSYRGASPDGRNDKSYTFSDIVFVFLNGETVYITNTFLYNGQYWGVMSPSHTYQPPGWILMDDLLLVYSRSDFETENENNFYSYTGNYDAVLSAEKLVEWQWPGSDQEKKIIYDNIPKYANVQFAYKDKDGREWGKTTYDGWWICLNDPENDKIPAFNPSAKAAKWSPDGDIHWSDSVTVWPPADLTKLMAADKPQSAFTDITKNDFFQQHSADVQKLDRSRFYANSPDGYVALRAEPGFDAQILTHWALGQFTYLNGEQISIDYVYNLNGEYWGYVSYANDEPHPPGWVPMDQLLMGYCNTDFVNEHKDSFFAYTDDITAAVTTDTFVLWEWPSSDSANTYWGIKVLQEGAATCQYACNDEKGREWVYIDKQWNYQHVYGWLCIDDPESRELPTFNPAPKPIKWSPDGVYDWSSANAVVWPPAETFPDNGGALNNVAEWPPVYTAIVITISVLFIVSAVYFMAFRKPKGTKPGEKSDE